VEWQSSISRNTGRWYLGAGAGIFTSALAYYVVFRSQLPWPGHLVNLEWAGLGLFVTQRSSIIKAILGIWAIGLVHELFISTFTATDVLAGTLGAVVALCIAIFATRASSHTVSTLSGLPQAPHRTKRQSPVTALKPM